MVDADGLAPIWLQDICDLHDDVSVCQECPNSATLWYVQCVNSGDTMVLHKTLDTYALETGDRHFDNFVVIG